MKRWDAALAEAQNALKMAEAKNDRELVRLNRLLLRAIDERRGAEPRGLNAADRAFVRELLEKLSRWAVATPRRRRDTGPWGLDRAA